MADKNKNKEAAQTVDGNVVVAEPRVEPVVVPVAAAELAVPTAEVEIVEEVPLAEPTAIVPNFVFEQTAPANNGAAEAPVFDIANKSNRRVRIIGEGSLGEKMLKRGDVTDDAEYVALLETERGRLLVEEVK